MLAPKRSKHRKQFRGKMRGVASRGTEIVFGDYALKSLSSGWLSSKQIEAGRKVLTKYTQKGGRVWIRIFPDKPITMKSAEVPMGSGKGSLDHFVAIVKPGRIIFEIDGIEQKVAEEAMRRAAHKLPVKTRFIIKEKQ